MVCLYFPTEEDLLRHQKAADDEGFPTFNAWLLQAIAAGTSGTIYPAGYVDRLIRDKKKVEGWLDASREEAADLRSQVKTLQGQRDSLLALVAGLPGGPEVIARHTRQNGRVVA